MSEGHTFCEVHVHMSRVHKDKPWPHAPLGFIMDFKHFLKLALYVFQVTGVNPEHLLVTVLPGLPTAAEFFLLPDKELTEGKADKTVTHLDQVSTDTLC